MFIFSFLSLMFAAFVLALSLYGVLFSSTTLIVDLGSFCFANDCLEFSCLFVFDMLSGFSGFLVISLTLFAQFFGVEYMYREAFIMRLLYLLIMFATSVIFLFFVYDFFLVLVVWELIGLFSLLLVNFYAIRLYTVKAAFKTYIFSRLSDFFIFIAFFLLIISLGTTDFSILFLNCPYLLFFNIFIFNYGFNLLNVFATLVVLAGAIKAAQFPFHVWLPDAMEAPTPASALIHSSTLVIMGIYLVLRLSVIFEFCYFANVVLLVLGGLTITVGAISASFQNDIKKLVAYSTVSQMGYLFCGCGFLAYPEVLFYLAAHAMNKAFLFMLVGYIVHFFNGNTDFRFMGNLLPHSHALVFLVLTVSLNLSGLPLSSGFIAKEFLVFQTLRADAFSFFVRVFWFFSFFFTGFYMLFLNWFVFFRAKQNSIKLYNYNKPTVLFSFTLNGIAKTLQMNLFSAPLLSKLSVLVYSFFFLFILFFGEFILYNLFGFFSAGSIATFNYFASYNTLFNFQPLLFSTTAADYLSFLVLFLFISAMRYLRCLVN